MQRLTDVKYVRVGCCLHLQGPSFYLLPSSEPGAGYLLRVFL